MSTVFKTDAGRDAVFAAYRRVLSLWPVPHEELHVPTHLGDTFVVACGPKDAPPLIVLHGAQANASATMFDAALWSQHFRVYAIDMIGEAGFSAEVRPPLDGDAHALWLDDVLAGLGIARAAFNGTSLGGWLALDYAARRPQRVSALALLCPAGIGRQKNFLLKVLPLLLLGPWGLRRIRYLVFGETPTDVPPSFAPFMALMDLIGRHIRTRVLKIPKRTDAQLAALPPSLVIIGGKDVLLDSYDTKSRLEAHAPRADIRFYPEARHFIPAQAQTVLDFLLAHVTATTKV